MCIFELNRTTTASVNRTITVSRIRRKRRNSKNPTKLHINAISCQLSKRVTQRHSDRHLGLTFWGNRNVHEADGAELSRNVCFDRMACSESICNNIVDWAIVLYSTCRSQSRFNWSVILEVILNVFFAGLISGRLLTLI